MKHLNTAQLTATMLAVVAITSVGLYGQAVVASSDFTKVGLSGGQFLKIGVGARATAMAGAHSAVADDLSSIFWNPSGLTAMKRYAVDFSQTFWFAGMTHNFAAAVIPIGQKYRVAASFANFTSGDIKITTMDQQEGTGGLYQVSDVAIGLTLAGQLTDQFSFGITAKYISMGFTNMNASSVAIDVGTRYATNFEGIVLGFSMNSLGSQTEYNGADAARSRDPISGINTLPVEMRMLTSPFDLPLSFRLGASTDLCKNVLFDSEVNERGILKHSLVAAVDFETFSDVGEQYSFGAEYTWEEFVSVRAGYRMGSDQFGFAGGVGIRYVSEEFSGRIDYSLNPTTNLGLINRVSIAMRFD
ncbi:MAG: PorV/PorQ family protein [Candidatus Kapabacteria bacterium]|nr:PorV/PorQ family protein [Candidatus Kapabacteria bacterium]